MPSSYQPPPLLLTKRLITFLNANLSPQIQTALLATPSGKLLSYASTSTPASTLRTQATVAASLWAVHAAAAAAATSSSVSSSSPLSLPDTTTTTTTTSTSSTTSADNPNPAPPTAQPPPPATRCITLSLAGGSIAVIRRLQCGLLFVCISPAAPTATTDTAATQLTAGGSDNEAVGSPALAASPPPEAEMAAGAGGSSNSGSSSAAAAPPAGAGGAGVSVGPVTGATAVAARRHVENLARWLDDKLGTLSVPDEGIGVAVR